MCELLEAVPVVAIRTGGGWKSVRLPLSIQLVSFGAGGNGVKSQLTFSCDFDLGQSWDDLPDIRIRESDHSHIFSLDLVL